MKARSLVARALLVVGLLLLFAPAAGAAEIKVMSSAGFKAAYLELAAEFERATGHKIANAWDPRWAALRKRCRTALRAASRSM